MTLSLAENIRALRKERKMTQEALATVLGVTVGAVHKWEAGMSVPELDMIVRMADFFDSSVDALLGYRMQDNNLDACRFYLAQGFRIGGFDNRVSTGTSQAGKADLYFYLDL